MARECDEDRVLIGPVTGKGLPAGVTQPMRLRDKNFKFIGSFGISDHAVLDTIRKELENSRRVFVVHSDTMDKFAEYQVSSRSTEYDKHAPNDI